MYNIHTATLRLFNAILVSYKVKSNTTHTPEVTKHCIKSGFILSPDIVVSESILSSCEKMIGISGEKANQSFHKSWKKVRDASDVQLFIEQIWHYITTYGYERLGIYDEDTVFIPAEALNIPEINIDIIELVVVKALTGNEILDKIIKLASGIALSQETIDDIMTIVKSQDYDLSFIDQVKNRELHTRLCDYYHIVPKEPVAFLRYLVNKVTDKNLLIKNKELVDAIKETDKNHFIDELMQDAPENLASIFLRYKPIFLALRSVSNNKTAFNRLRKKAKTQHKALPEDFLNNITAHIKNDNLDTKKLSDYLDTTTIWRKIRLAYALHFRLSGSKSILYRVRNGRGWATEFDWPKEKVVNCLEAYNIVIDSIAADLRKKVNGKFVLMPENIDYALPATEKQFTGNLPTGTSVKVDSDMIIGIHWINTDRRIDLDLSLIDCDSKIGWDGYYRSGSRDILFSGDVTDARKPNGASELFYIKKNIDSQKALMVNHYTFDNDEVPMTILVAKKKLGNLSKNYMVDPNDIILSTKMTVIQRQNFLGIVSGNRFYFANVNVGNSITSCATGHTLQAREYFLNRFENAIGLEDILIKAGAKIVRSKSECNYVDLSPTVIDKTTFISLLTE